MSPEDIRSALRELNPHYRYDIAANSQRVKALYAPALAARPPDGITFIRDMAYGTHPRQVLDVFRPAGASEADVAVFVHGGAFVRGAKSGPEGVYDNVLTWFARQGFVGVNVEYRLAPEAVYPEGGRDVATALAWVRDHIAEHGGNPSRVLLIGHSAGGTHVASYASDPAVGVARCDAHAMVLLSARLRADTQFVNPNADGVKAYFGADPSLYEARSPVSHAAHCRLPVMVAFAEHENPLLEVYSLEYAQRIAAERLSAPRVVQCLGHNHMSLAAHFDSGEDTLGQEILAFWHACVPAGVES